MSKWIGLDLGSSSARAAVAEGGSPAVIPGADGRRFTPSAVHFPKEGRPLVGMSARRSAATAPERTITDIKRRLGQGQIIPMNGVNYKPPVVSALILRELKERAEAYLGEPAADGGAAQLIIQLLPALDSLELAISQGSPDTALLTGVKMAYKQIQETLSRQGVAMIDRLGQKFDPHLEEAVAIGSLSQGAPGTVCQVLRKGYRLGDQVIRYAMVQVVAEP